MNAIPKKVWWRRFHRDWIFFTWLFLTFAPTVFVIPGGKSFGLVMWMVWFILGAPLMIFLGRRLMRKRCEADEKDAEDRHVELLRFLYVAGYAFAYQQGKKHCESEDVFEVSKPGGRRGIYCLNCYADVADNVYMPSLAELLPDIPGTSRVATDLEAADRELVLLVHRRSKLFEEHQRRLAAEGTPPYRVATGVTPPIVRVAEDTGARPCDEEHIDDQFVEEQARRTS